MRDVSIEVTAGEIFVIMGLSGSGKSTLVRCLSRLVEATAGEVIFEGRDLLRAGEKELIEIRRHKMGMVFQHFALLPHLRVLDNVAFPALGPGRGPGRAREARPRGHRARRACAAARGISRASSPAASSSASASRAAWRSEPQIWFLDEPFSALDPLIRREMQDELAAPPGRAAQDDRLHHP